VACSRCHFRVVIQWVVDLEALVMEVACSKCHSQAVVRWAVEVVLANLYLNRQLMCNDIKEIKKNKTPFA